ncbi:MAG TPA: hypothetical protein VK467_04155 [Gemmatimonadales bacterium]|nr:hypothetical protein [Gemmatimonadales bacterium]
MADKDLEARFAELSERNAALMAALEAKIAAPAGGITPDQLEAIITRSTAAASKGSELIASKYKPENVDHLHKGPFEHPEGGITHPKPPLKREMYHGGFRLRDQDISYVEAEALNALSDSLGRAQRRLARNGTWVAEVNDRDDRLTIRTPMKTIDDRADLPGLLQIAMELTSGDRALETADILAELALLKSEMAALKGVPA